LSTDQPTRPEPTAWPPFYYNAYAFDCTLKLKFFVPRLSGKVTSPSAWLKAVRPAFLPASLIPVLVGLTYTWSKTHLIQPIYAVVTFLGVALAHMSADLFNDYFDYIHGTDQLSKLRGLSGGSGVLVSGALKPREVLRGGYTLLGLALVCGAYLALETGPIVLALMALGAASIYAYTSLLQRIGLGEFTLALERIATVTGTYYVQTRTIDLQPMLLGVLLGVLSIYMVYYAGFPDYEADRDTGKKTLVVVVGYEEAVRIAPLFPIATYILQALFVGLGLLPYTTLTTFLVTPLAYASLKHMGRPSVPGSYTGGLRHTALFTRLYGVVLALSLLLV
jgi:1,4-dihydroxy-2-naphthoate octaprenyltransferase